MMPPKRNEAWSNRSNTPISTYQRLVEYCELLGMCVNNQLIDCTSSSHGPVPTTNLDYWGIKTKQDWMSWVYFENSKFIKKHRHEIKSLLQKLSEDGWASCAEILGFLCNQVTY